MMKCKKHAVIKLNNHAMFKWKKHGEKGNPLDGNGGI